MQSRKTYFRDRFVREETERDNLREAKWEKDSPIHLWGCAPSDFLRVRKRRGKWTKKHYRGPGQAYRRNELIRAEDGYLYVLGSI